MIHRIHFVVGILVIGGVFGAGSAFALEHAPDPTKLPDIVVGKLHITGLNTVSYSVWNTSSVPAGRFTTVIKNLTTGEQVTSSDVLLGSSTPIAKTIQFANPFRSSKDRIRVEVDPENVVQEFNEKNNVAEGTVGEAIVPGAALGLRSKDSGQLYRLYGNRLLWVPNLKTLYASGVKDKDIAELTDVQIALYPRVRHVRIEGDDSVIYYLTEIHLKRKLADKSIFESYPTNRLEDIITIPKSVLDVYGDVKFVRYDDGRPGWVYVLDHGKKRALADGDAMKRLKANYEEVEPLNLPDFRSYPEGEPIRQ